MNADRRKRLQAAIDDLDAIRDSVEEIAAEERTAADNVAEHACCLCAEAADESATACEDAHSAFDELETAITEAIGE
jgi:hypothetical protein